jgi:hypothetical protein
MLREFFFSLKKSLPQGQIARGDRQRFVRVQRNVVDRARQPAAAER